MINVTKGEIVLEARNGCEFENDGVLNPACVEKDGVTHMFYRAVGKGNFSTIGYCQIKNNKIIYRSDKPILAPEYRYESQGLEDPRITFLEGRYYMFYTAFDGLNAVVAYAVSNDLKKWEKKGLITPQISYDEAENIFRDSGVGEKYIYYEKIFRRDKSDQVYLWEKDAMLFPKKINGKYALLHRVLPGIQIAYFDDFDQLNQTFWKDYLKKLDNYLVLDPKYSFQNSYIGSGCVPIETNDGWLLIYHSAEVDIKKGQVYHASAALLDLDDPTKVIGLLPYPLFSPETEWEKKGVVNNVVFPTGAVVDQGKILIFYGAADKVIGLKKIDLSNLLEELKKHETKKTN
jgi:predicted GH43/DUF377 family glycosyl hydrolase